MAVETKSKHSPEPWLIVGGGGQLTTIVTADGPYKISHIARLHVDWLTSHSPEELAANAHLIAAAPWLLEALRYALACAEGRERDYAGKLEPMMKAAIALAEGKAS